MSISVNLGSQEELIRFSYLSVFESRPDNWNPDKMIYSVVPMVPKNSKTILNQLEVGLTKAIEEGIEKRRFTKAMVKGYLAAFKKGFPITPSRDEFYVPIQDGDKAIELAVKKGKAKGEEFENVYFWNCQTTQRPKIYDMALKRVVEDLESDYYSGYWGRLVVGMAPYDNSGAQGIGIYLQKIQLVKPGERLDGSMSADSAWGGFDDSDKVVLEDEADNPMAAE